MKYWNGYVGDDETMKPILPPLRRLLERKKISNDVPLILHSDQRSQYPAADYQRLLKDYNVTQSMPRAGAPHDNTVISCCI